MIFLFFFFKTAETIAKDFVWEKMREDVKKFVLQCAPCLEKQGVNLKEGEHIPRISHKQGVHGPGWAHFGKICLTQYLLTMMDGFLQFVMLAPLKSKKVSSANYVEYLNTRLKAPGEYPKLFTQTMEKSSQLT